MPLDPLEEGKQRFYYLLVSESYNLLHSLPYLTSVHRLKRWYIVVSMRHCFAEQERRSVCRFSYLQFGTQLCDCRRWRNAGEMRGRIRGKEAF